MAAASLHPSPPFLSPMLPASERVLLTAWFLQVCQLFNSGPCFSNLEKLSVDRRDWEEHLEEVEIRVFLPGS